MASIFDPNRQFINQSPTTERGRPQLQNPGLDSVIDNRGGPERVRQNITASRQTSSIGPGQGDRSRGIEDVYRAHVPYSFVVVGGQIAQVEAFEIVKNSNSAEPAEASFKVSIDALDFSVIGNSSVNGSLVPVEIWTGYLSDIAATNKTQEQQINDLRQAILKKSLGTLTADGRGTAVRGNQQQRKFSKRFDGYVYQPEYEFSNEEEMATLKCRDWIGYIKEFKIFEDFKDSQCEVGNIIAKFNRDINGLNFRVFDRSNYSMADPDSEDGKRIYKTSGRSYGDVLTEICDRTGLRIFQNGLDINLKLQERNPLVWKMYKGSDSSSRTIGDPFGTPFDRLVIRQGVKGQAEVGGRDLIVEVVGVSRGSGKKAKAKQLRVKFPAGKEPVAGTKLISIPYPYGSVDDKSKLEIYAEEVYKRESSRQIAMSMDLGFGNPFMELYDAVEFVDGDRGNMQFLANKWFEIVSISDRFSIDGYSQTIEGRNNIAYEKAFGPKDQIGPKPMSQSELSQQTTLPGPKQNRPN